MQYLRCRRRWVKARRRFGGQRSQIDQNAKFDGEEWICAEDATGAPQQRLVILDDNGDEVGEVVETNGFGESRMTIEYIDSASETRRVLFRVTKMPI